MTLFDFMSAHPFIGTLGMVTATFWLALFGGVALTMFGIAFNQWGAAFEAKWTGCECGEEGDEDDASEVTDG